MAKMEEQQPQFNISEMASFQCLDAVWTVATELRADWNILVQIEHDTVLKESDLLFDEIIALTERNINYFDVAQTVAEFLASFIKQTLTQQLRSPQPGSIDKYILDKAALIESISFGIAGKLVELAESNDPEGY